MVSTVNDRYGCATSAFGPVGKCTSTRLNPNSFTYPGASHTVEELLVDDSNLCFAVAGTGDASAFKTPLSGLALTHIRSDLAAARPEIFHRIGSSDTQHDILNSADTLGSGDCKPDHASNTNACVCRCTAGSSVNGTFQVKVGTNSVDKATSALASECSHSATLMLDTTAPSVPAGLAAATGGRKVTRSCSGHRVQDKHGVARPCQASPADPGVTQIVDVT